MTGQVLNDLRAQVFFVGTPQEPEEEEQDPPSSSGKGEESVPEQEPSSEVIGFHVTPEMKISFHSSPDFETLSSAQGLIPVRLPERGRYPQLRSTIGNIANLLRNFHFHPVYSEEKKEVCFTSIPPENKTWETYREIQIPSEASLHCHSYGVIRFAVSNKVTTWDYNTDQSHTVTLGSHKITTMAEAPNGELIIGKENGDLWIGSKKLDQNFTESIFAILPITETLYFIRCKNKSYIFNIEENKITAEIEESFGQVSVLGNDTLVTLRDKKLRIWKVDHEGKLEEKDHPLKDAEFSRIRIISDTTLMLISSKCIKYTSDYKGFTLFDVKANLLHSHDIALEINSLPFPEDENTFVVGYANTQNCVSLRFYSTRQEEHSLADSAGNWCTTAMTALSDGSIMYATNSKPSGIHIITRDGKVVFTNQPLLKNREVRSLKELVDGSILIQFNKFIMIIKPRIEHASDRQYQIEKLNLELRYNPTNLDLYHDLAKLHEQESDEQYQTFLAGLEAAIKGNNLYQARRFYEKARKIHQEEPCRVFLSYLEKTPYRKQMKQVLLDLYHIQRKKKKGIKPPFDPSIPCKRRLFIGEGTFSFTEALIKKHIQTHPSLSCSIVATELHKREEIYVYEGKDEFNQFDTKFLERMTFLHDKQVDVRFGFDGQRIHKISKDVRFERIHWNCPFGFSSPPDRNVFKTVIPNFFRSCSEVQEPGDRIHVTLSQPDDEYFITRQKENPIVLGATSANYRLIRKRDFGSHRYPGYIHTKTGTTEKYLGGGKEREFVFEKAEPLTAETPIDLARAEALRDPTKKQYEIKTDKDPKSAGLEDYYFACSTDEDSSDYYQSD